MPRMLREALTEFLTPKDLDSIFSAFDIIGDIAIIKIPKSFGANKKIIGDTILRNLKAVKTVFAQTSSVTGNFRIRELEYLAGENKTETEYRENGCRFKVDVAKVYFSPRLSTERLRVAMMVRDGEVITNMFAGVGTYSVLIAKKNKRCKVYSIDSNPVAIELCRINAKANKVEDNVVPLLGDAQEVIKKKFLANLIEC
jgi:tRNA (guanine37-N1)-methyltransferase